MSTLKATEKSKSATIFMIGDSTMADKATDSDNPERGWGQDLLINKAKQAGGILFNLASKDIQPSFDWKKVEQSVRILTPEFKVSKNGKLNTVVIYAKMARGEMTRYIIKNKIQDPELLKGFTWEGFRYDETFSSPDSWIFLQ